MHDPKSVAFEIRSPFFRRRSELFPEGLARTLVVVWHCDPCRDGSDDSCGRFMRARHGNPEILGKIESLFRFNWDSDHGGWFHADGHPGLSVPGITLQMFQAAAWEHFGHDRRKVDRFLHRHVVDILDFAENPIDSLHSAITGRYGIEPREERIAKFARSVYGCVLQWTRPWYRNPVFHVHHWEITIPVLQTLQRWLFSRCAACGKRFPWGYSPVSYSWDSPGPRWFRGEPGVYHHECRQGDPAAKPPMAEVV